MTEVVGDRVRLKGVIEASKFVVTTPIPRFAVRPVIMPPLPRSA